LGLEVVRVGRRAGVHTEGGPDDLDALDVGIAENDDVDVVGGAGTEWLSRQQYNGLARDGLDGLGGIVVPFIGIKIIDVVIHALRLA